MGSLDEEESILEGFKDRVSKLPQTSMRVIFDSIFQEEDRLKFPMALSPGGGPVGPF
jgi:hypothetical protein